jgi:hypothetical protein
MAAFLETAKFLPKDVVAYFIAFSAAFWSAKISVTDRLCMGVTFSNFNQSPLDM